MCSSDLCVQVCRVSGCVFRCVGCPGVLLQAVHHGASLSSIVLLLPLVHLPDELEEGALGDGRVSVHGPAQELELLHHAVPILGLVRDDKRGG